MPPSLSFAFAFSPALRIRQLSPLRSSFTSQCSYTSFYSPAASPLRRLHSTPRCNVSGNEPPSPTLPASPTIGFIGLGVMGLPMVLNLATAFPSSSILTWNRTPKLDALAEHPSITATESASDVLKSAHITFSMLSTPAAMRAVLLDDALHTIPHGGCLVDCSTLQVSDMQAVRDVVKTRGGFFLEAPVSGSKVPAEKGQLIFLCGGDETLFQHSVVQKAFDAMGKRALFLGDVGAGTKMKLVVNQLMATMLAALSESIVLTEALDLSVPDLLEVLSLGAMNNPMFALKGPMMKSGEKRYDTNFPLEHAQKDVRFAQALGDEHGISMAVSSAANEWYKAAKGLGLSREDFSAVIESVRASAGKQ